MPMAVKDAWFVRSSNGFGLFPINGAGWAATAVFFSAPIIWVVLTKDHLDLHVSEAEKGVLGALWFFAFWIVVQYKSCTNEEYERARKNAGVTRRGLWGRF